MKHVEVMPISMYSSRLVQLAGGWLWLCSKTTNIIVSKSFALLTYPPDHIYLDEIRHMSDVFRFVSLW